MNPKMDLRESENWWDNEMDYSKYGFSIYNLFLDGRRTGYKAIVSERTGGVVNISSEKYKLLPNEVVLEVANEVAEEIGLKPFKTVTESINDWRTWKTRAKNASMKSYTRRNFKKAGRVLVQEMQGNPHALVDGDMTGMFAFYKFPEPVDMDAKERFHFGLAIRNSIDGSSKLAIDGFSYRFICQNMSIATIQAIAKANQIEGSMRKVHKMNLDIGLDDLRDRMLFVVSKVKNLQTMYGRWMTEQINMDTVRRLGTSIPKTYLPEYIQVEKKKVTLTADQTPTKWKVYNDLTAEIWHRPVEMKTKQNLFETLHIVMTK